MAAPQGDLADYASGIWAPLAAAPVPRNEERRVTYQLPPGAADSEELDLRRSGSSIDTRRSGGPSPNAADPSGFESFEFGAMCEWVRRQYSDLTSHPDCCGPRGGGTCADVDKYLLEFDVENTFINARVDGERVLKSSVTNPEGFGARAESIVQTLVSSSSLSIHDGTGGETTSLLPKDSEEAVPKRELTEEEISTIPHDEEGRLTSIGSVGHATGLCRPCAFSNNPKKQGCINGIHCAFCHFKHPKKKKPPRPPKQQRLLKKLAAAQAAADPQPNGVPPPPMVSSPTASRGGSIPFGGANLEKLASAPYPDGVGGPFSPEVSQSLFSVLAGSQSPLLPLSQNNRSGTYQSPLPSSHNDMAGGISPMPTPAPPLSPVLYILAANSQHEQAPPSPLMLGGTSRRRVSQLPALPP